MLSISPSLLALCLVRLRLGQGPYMYLYFVDFRGVQHMQRGNALHQSPAMGDA